MNDRQQQLALVVRTVETGSSSKAAREFGLAQPFASRAALLLRVLLGPALGSTISSAGRPASFARFTATQAGSDPSSLCIMGSSCSGAGAFRAGAWRC